MAKVKNIKLSDLKFDEKNINKGSEFGNALLEKSLREVGAGRSVLLDKNGVLIAGNKTVEKAGELGFEDIIVIESNGKSLVAVQRTDIDINSPEGAKMKILDNTVSKHNYVEDAEISEIVCEEAELLNVNSYGLHSIDYDKDDENDSTVSFTPKAKNQIKISFPNKSQFNQAYKEIASLMKTKFPDAVIKGK
jgi:hypothetical protein